MSIPKNNPLARRSLAELKIRSRILLKAADQQQSNALKILSSTTRTDPPYKLKDALKSVARTAGFKDWQHARHVLGGSAQIGEDMGEIWYSVKCHGLLNIWCRNYGEAREQLEKQEDYFLFPYKTQFIVANDAYVNALGVETGHKLRQSENRDLVATYGSSYWDDLTFLRLQEAMGSPNG